MAHDTPRDATDTVALSVWEDSDQAVEFGLDVDDGEPPEYTYLPCSESLGDYVGDAAVPNICGSCEDEQLLERCQTGELDYLHDFDTMNVQHVLDGLPADAIVNLADEDEGVTDPIAEDAAAEWLNCIATTAERTYPGNHQQLLHHHPEMLAGVNNCNALSDLGFDASMQTARIAPLADDAADELLDDVLVAAIDPVADEAAADWLHHGASMDTDMFGVIQLVYPQ